MRTPRILPVWISIVLVTAFLPACRRQPSVATAPTPPAPVKTFTSKKSNTAYTYIIVPHQDEEFEKFEVPTPGLAAPSADNFRGTDRKAAKTSLAAGSPQTFADVAALLRSSLFVADSKMINHKPPISKDATSDRVAEEKHNVAIT